MKNQIIFPMAFYVFYMWCLAGYVFRQRSGAVRAGKVSIKYFRAYTTTVAMAWFFVASRLAHAWIHLGSNRVQWRAGAFVAGWLTVVGLWGQLVYVALQ